MWWLLIPLVGIVGAWVYGAQKVVSNAPPIPTDPVPPLQIPKSSSQEL